MEINDKVDFSDTMNLPKRTILTNDDIAKKEKFFLERMQEVRRYREVLNKNKNSNKVYNISESPMKIQDKLDITYVQNKILKDIVIRYRLQKGDVVNHELDFMHLQKNEDLSGEKKLEIEEIVKGRSLTKRKLTEITRNQIQKMKNLGLVVNYSNFSCSTLEKNFSSIVIQKFYEMYKNKEVYEKEQERLDSILLQNENMAKLRHDYINQITVVNALAVTDPQKAIELLDNMREEYKERTQI